MQNIRKDVPESHLNPSRKKIPFSICKKGNFVNDLFFENSIVSTEAKEITMNLQFDSNQKSLHTPNTAKNVNNENSIADQNRELKKQIKRVNEINSELLDRLDKKQDQIEKLNEQYKDLLLKYNSQLSKINDNLCSQLSGSKNKHSFSLVRAHHFSFQDDQFIKKSKLSKTSRQSSKNGILKLKQSFDKLDFKEVEKIARYRKPTVDFTDDN